MLVVASYNRSDWTYGWISILEGFSIYVNSELEETLDNGMTLCKSFYPSAIEFSPSKSRTIRVSS